jgi:hypothetical protein
MAKATILNVFVFIKAQFFAKVQKELIKEKCSAHKKARLGAKASKKSEK